LANPSGSKLYQIWACGQLCLGWALIPVKPTPSGFTLHMKNRYLLFIPPQISTVKKFWLATLLLYSSKLDAFVMWILATTIAKNSSEFSPFSSNVVPMIHTPFMIFENIFMIFEKI
jgi:hypothetical protein